MSEQEPVRGSVFDQLDSEEHAMARRKAGIMAGWVSGWVLRQIIRGACLALGGWVALRALGAI